MRRQLARDAAAQGWSVRELEARARTATAPTAERRPRRRRAVIHPDQQAAIEQITDAFGAALGRDIDVSARGSEYRAEITFASLDDALDLARRLRVRSVA